MNGFNVVGATEGRAACLIGRKAKVIVAARKHGVDLVLEISTDVCKGSDGPLRVRDRIGAAICWPAVCPPPCVEWAVEHLSWVPEIVSEQRVDDSLTTVGTIDLNMHVCNHEGEIWKS